MKRILMAFAVAVGWAATTDTVRADWGGYTTAGPAAGATLPPPGQIAGPGTLFGAGAATPGQPTAQYGLNPHLRKLFKFGNGCNNCGKGGGYAGPAYGPPPYTPVMQGTLVFPHHPYIRSPRDFFMYEPNR